MKVSTLDNLFQDVPDKRLAEIWCEFNRWGWPHDLPQPEERKSIEEGGNPRRSAMMGYIMSRIGYRDCIREWNRDTMTDAEFDAWYRVNRRAA